MSAVNVRGSRLVAKWYPPKARRWCFEVYIGAEGTLQLNLGRLHLGHYRLPWWAGLDRKRRPAPPVTDTEAGRDA